MSRVSGRVPSVLQGMTQQPPELRLPVHGKVQINGVSSTTFGLGKRTGTDHVKFLSGLNLSQDEGARTWTSFLVRDSGERYILVYHTSLRIFGVDGKEYVVQFDPGAEAYLRAENPRRALTSMTLADTTLILNRSQIPRMKTDVSPAVTPEAVVWVRSGNYEQTYTVELNGTAYTYTSLSTVASIRTSEIASQLQTLLAAVSGFTVTYTAGDSHFFIRKADGTDFAITTKDSVGDSALGCIKNQAPSFADLPPVAPTGYVCQVLGSPGDSADDYWVRWDPERAATATDVRRGSWTECLAPETPFEIDAALMPHALERRQDNSAGSITGESYGIYFKLVPVLWDDRVVGDAESSPNPSFIGTPIYGLFLFQNRLGFVFNSNIVMSRSGDYFNFWRASATQVLDDDPIDVSVAPGRLAGDRVLNLRHAINFDESLVLVADRAQISLSGADPVTPTSIRPNLSMSVESDDFCRPVTVGDSMFIPFTDGGYCGLYEAVISGSVRKLRQVLLSENIPNLMYSYPRVLTACLKESTVFLTTEADRTRVYVYRWKNNGGDRIQSAWGYWDYGNDIIGMEVIDSTLWTIIRRSEGLSIESQELVPWSQNEQARFPILLDRKVPMGTGRIRIPSRDSGSQGGRQGDGPTDPGDPPDSGDLGGPLGGGVVVESLGPGELALEPIPGEAATVIPALEVALSGDFTGAGTSWLTSTSPSTIEGSRDRALVSYNLTTGISTVTLPYQHSASLKVVRGDTMTELPWEVGSTPFEITVRGDLTSIPAYAGFEYEFMYEFAPPMILSQTATGGQAVDRMGRLTVSRWFTSFNRSGPCVIRVYRMNGAASESVMLPRITGGGDANDPTSYTGNVLVMAASNKVVITAKSRYWWPLWIASAAWQGEYRHDFQ